MKPSVTHAHDVPAHDPGHHDDHGGVGKYVLVFISLCILTSASIFTTSPWWPFHDRPMYGWVFMMTVSTAKALLVILFFMHLLWEANWKWVLTVPAACMSLFLVLMLIPDVGLRTRHYSEERWSAAAYPTPLHDVHATPADGHAAGDGHGDATGHDNGQRTDGHDHTSEDAEHEAAH